MDDRLVGLQDVMPTLLDLAGVDIPSSVNGQSMVSASPCKYLFCEHADKVCEASPNRGLTTQWGAHWPPPPIAGE